MKNRYDSEIVLIKKDNESQRYEKKCYKDSLKELKKRIKDLETCYYDELQSIKQEQVNGSLLGGVGCYKGKYGYELHNKENIQINCNRSGNGSQNNIKVMDGAHEINKKQKRNFDNVAAGGGRFGIRERSKSRDSRNVMQKFKMVIGKFENKLSKIHKKMHSVNLNDSCDKIHL